ncbi:MAG TPA: hypothetical protein VN200_01445 [Rhodoglobus sp.]|nr:hypothetical protein [Rhodoglobus sp.]
MAAWSDFNVAMAGAAAALAGLIIVAMSVNVQKVLTSPSLTARGAASIAALVFAVVATGLALIPDQPTWLLGVELLVPLLLAAAVEVQAVRQIAAGQGVEAKTLKIAVGLAPVAAFAVGTGLLIAGIADGFVAIAIGCLAAIAAAVLYAWVALVEVLR